MDRREFLAAGVAGIAGAVASGDTAAPTSPNDWCGRTPLVPGDWPMRATTAG